MTVAEVLEQRIQAGALRRLYAETSNDPSHWVGEDDEGRLWRWPAEADGWSEREPYRGDVSALMEVRPGYAIGTGWPGLEPLH